jgi:hypothetical protein
MATRAEIEARMADILNRTDFSTRITTWFDRAHRSAQRRINFQFMQVTETHIVTVGENSVAAPFDIKKSHQLYIYDPVGHRAVRFFRETSIGAVRDRRFKSDPLTRDDERHSITHNLFAHWYQTLEFTPVIGAGEAAYVFRYDYYRFMDPVDNDFLMKTGEDYLVYRGLRESAPFLGADSRLQTWITLEVEAFKELASLDVDARSGGALVMRG